MSDERAHDDQPGGTDARHRRGDTDSRAGGGTDSDDTTQADAGMVGGTGAAPTEGTSQPLGTEREGGDGDEEASGER